MNYFRFLRENAPWLLTGFLLSFSSSYGQTFFISVFAGEIRRDFGLSHGQWGSLYMVGTLASAGVMLWAGTLADKFRVRVLGTFVLLGLVLATLSMSVLSAAWAIPFVIFALRFTGQGMSTHTAIVAMGRWFSATRGRAMSIMTMGMATGQAILPVVAAYLLLSFHWQTLWVMAAGMAFLAIPLLWLLLTKERTPQSHATSESATGMGQRHWSRKEMLMNPLFWFILPAFIGPPAWGTALLFHHVHLTEVRGWPLIDFLALFPIFTVLSIVANFAAGWAADRFGAGRVFVLNAIPWALGFAILGMTESLFGVAIGFVFYGIALGASAPTVGAFWPEYYGTQKLGSIKSLVTAVMVLGSAIGPGLTGALIDVGFGFPAQLVMFGGYFALSGLLAAMGIARVRPAIATA